jgi:AraC-like DNA-binding protein
MSLVNEYNIFKRESKLNEMEFPFEIPHIASKAANMSMYHWHDFLEISLIIDGYGTYYIEDKCIPVAKGDIIIINNIERHRVQYNSEMPLYETVLHFSADLLQGISLNGGQFFNYSGAAFFNKLEVNQEQRETLVSIIDEIIEEYTNKKPYYELFISAKIIAFIALVQRYNNVRKNTQLEDKFRGFNINRLESILKYLSTHFGPETNLQSVAKHFYLNSAYFSEYFKKNLGITFSEYMRGLRIDNAIKLMRTSKMKLTDIAFASGYASLSSFYEAFSKVTGVSPKKYLAKKTGKIS